MKIVSLIIGVIVLVFGIVYLVTNSGEEISNVTQESATENVPKTAAVTTEETTAPEASVTDEVATAQAITAEDVAPGTYTTYDAGKIAKSDAEHIMLFFHAKWCPTCKALDADIVANADSIPAGVEIYKVDYDTSTDLERKYGVTTQHSIIEINAAGTAESGITHPSTLKALLATI